ncbi:restriction endonuclease subunit S [Escherichia coli]|uniref:restriction endonuclease subunit S n=1 Tax=Escherichia coli TaxID=562 RepID=UPI001432D9E3|nr:restriction endonuclease subunit S [Escherichia coli]NJZ95083.1 restriction endonuclease subunit S [Escherichia coli]HDD9962695.1 restriction endonuclease subunit S [Escherichia coli]
MSELSYLEKLLDGVEVEWKSLGDVVNFQRGRRLVKSQLETRGKYAVYQNSMTPLGYYHEYNVAAQSSFIICAGAAGEIGYSENEFWAADDVHFAITPEYINDRFLFHFLLTQKNKISGQVRRASIPRLSKSVIEKLEFPIPCPDNPEKSLAIQSEIVRILDKFTALTAELTAELNMRKKQYNYYRDQLLSFKEGEVEWKTLGDVTKKWYSGGTPTAGKIEYYENGNIPWLRTQEVKFSEIDSTEIKITQAALKNSSAKWIPRNCVIIAISGATAGRSAINKIPLTTNQHCGCLEIDDTKALYRYVFHWVSFNYENIKSLGQGARGDLNSTIIKNFKLPIPHASDPQKSLKEQARIVEILDKFDTLTNSITEGLPREIELRQKQYEYYRDLLFSFPKPETVSN